LQTYDKTILKVQYIREVGDVEVIVHIPKLYPI